MALEVTSKKGGGHGLSEKVTHPSVANTVSGSIRLPHSKTRGNAMGEDCSPGAGEPGPMTASEQARLVFLISPRSL